MWLLYYRIYRKRGADKALNHAKGKNEVSGYDLQSASMAIKFFWPRLLATTWGWVRSRTVGFWLTPASSRTTCPSLGCHRAAHTLSLFYGAKIFASTFVLPHRARPQLTRTDPDRHRPGVRPSIASGR